MGLENNIPEGWIETTLGKSINLIGGGTPKTTIEEYWDGDIPWLSVVDFNNDNRWVSKTEKTITKLGLEKSSTKLLNKGDVIISARGTVGALAQLKYPMTFNQSCYGIRQKENISSENFMFYLIKYSIQKISRNVHGAVFDTITKQTFDFININLPPLQEQKAIAKVLTAFDDKIELLQAQNKTLENMAQTIFKERFGKYQVGDELPEGWRIGKLGDLLQNIKTPVKKDMSIHDRVYIPIDEIPKKKLGLNSYKSVEEAKSSLILFEPGDILFGAMRCYFHRVNFSKIKGVTRTTVMVLRPKKEQFFCYSLILMNQSNTVNFANITSKGSTMPYAVWDNTLENMPIIIPREELIINYSLKVNSLINKIQNNINQIQSLTKTRDTLLPKLMSGQVKVNNIKQTVDA